MIGFGQEVKLLKKSDILINQVLENTFSFINEKKIKKTPIKFKLIKKEPLIDWNDSRLFKWKIINDKSIIRNDLKQ